MASGVDEHFLNERGIHRLLTGWQRPGWGTRYPITIYTTWAEPEIASLINLRYGPRVIYPTPHGARGEVREKFLDNEVAALTPYEFLSLMISDPIKLERKARSLAIVEARLTCTT